MEDELAPGVVVVSIASWRLRNPRVRTRWCGSVTDSVREHHDDVEPLGYQAC